MSSTFLYRLNSLTIYSCGMSMWNVEWLHTTIVSMDVETKTTASPPPPLKASDKKRRLSTDHKKVCKKATPAKSGSKDIEQPSLVQAKKPPTYKTVVQLLTMPLREESKTFLNTKGNEATKTYLFTNARMSYARRGTKKYGSRSQWVSSTRLIIWRHV